ncbi:uncharacterized protein LOC135843091 [Planococcus citri]|uniref:uncharacterized protein LOC135843091 n=1 Tax=Planococcus citri TaxID=170843 RepID=UPI0031FA394D
MIFSWSSVIFSLTISHLVIANLFNTQRKSTVFVDKSELLAAFFDTSTSPYNLVTCPFKFGKTTNLDMIALFSDVEVDKTRKPKRQNDTYAYSIFSTMKISRHRSIMRDHLARHPVIHLSFPENLQVSPKTAIGAELKKSMQKYRWLINLPASKLGSVDPEDIDYLKQLQSEDASKLRITEAILRISRVLYTYFNQSSVVLLIDNYDNTSCRSFVNEADPRYTLEYYKYLNKMISRALVNGTEYVGRALITGLTSLPFSLPYCDLSMIQHRVFLENHPFAGHYGYLEQEADELMVKFTMSEEMRSNLLNFYRGYRVQGTNLHVYNPNTIYQYHLHRQRLKQDYRESLKPHTDPIKEFDVLIHFYHVIKFREQILLLSINGRINLPYDITRYQTGALEEVGGLKLRKYYDSSDQYTRTLLTLFYEMGYFKRADDNDTSSYGYVWANNEPRICILHQLIQRFEHFSQFSIIANVILDIISSKPETSNLTCQSEYLRSNASRLHNGIRRVTDSQTAQIQFQAMIYHSLGRRVNTQHSRHVRIIDKVPLENRTSLTPYDMYLISPRSKKINGVIVARFESTVEEALKDALKIKFPANQTANSVKYIAMNVIEANQPEQVDALIHIEWNSPQR